MSKLEVLLVSTALSIVAQAASRVLRFLERGGLMSNLYSRISVATIRERLRIDRDAGSSVSGSSLPCIDRDLQALRSAVSGVLDDGPAVVGRSALWASRRRSDLAWLVGRVDDLRDALRLLLPPNR